MRASKVLIRNPLPGGGDVTSINRARRFVAKGLAEFTDPSQKEIVFLASPKQVAIVQSAEQRLHERITGVNYDRDDQSHFEQARQLPMIHPEKMIRKQVPADWSYRAAVWNRKTGRPRPEG